MNDVRYEVEFRGSLPDTVRIGDKLKIEGTVTVHALTGDLVDVSGIASKEYAVGELVVGLYSNELKVALA